MSKNQDARRYSNIYDDVKKVDIHSLSIGMHTSNDEIIKAINYWTSRKLTCILPGDASMAIIIATEIMRLESLLLAKTALTMDFFKVEEISSVYSEAESININRGYPDSKMPDATSQAGREKDLPFDESKPARWGNKTIQGIVTEKFQSHKTTETIKSELSEMVMNKIIDFGDNETLEVSSEKIFEEYFNKNIQPLIKELEDKEKGGKVVDMLPEKIKLSDLLDRCKTLLVEGKEEEVVKLAKKYLLTASYIPNKKKQTPEKWEESRITKWIEDIKGNLKNVQKQKVEKQQPSVNPKDTKEPHTQLVDETAQHVDSTKKDGEDASQEETSETEKYISISTDQAEKLFDIFRKKDLDPVELFTKEVVDNPTQYANLLIQVEDPISEIEKYKALGITAILAKTEEVEDSETESIVDSKTFLNESITLTEEIQHVENLIKSCIDLRGGLECKPENLDKIKEVVNSFYSTRSTGEYKKSEELIKLIKDRPQLLVDKKGNPNAKEFFSKMTDSLDTYKEGKETNLYKKVSDKILSKSNEKDFEDKYLPEFVKELKGKILMGMTSDGKQLINKNYFYTTYHVLHYIDQLIALNNKNNHPVNDKGEPAATATEGASNVSTDQAVVDEQKKVLTPLEKLENTLFSLIKNGGIVEDAIAHPILVSLKGETFNDTSETGTIKITDENYNKFITERYNDILLKYQNSLTEYPIQEMFRLIVMNHGLKSTPEDFVKNNIHLIARKDNVYLPLKGKLDDVDVIKEITSEEDLLKYVKEVYELQDKIISNEQAEENSEHYELSSVKSFKDMEELIVKKVKEGKASLEDLKVWAKKEVFNKLFENEVQSTPTFTKEEMLNTYLEAFTRKLYETPESIAKTNEAIQKYIDTEIVNTEFGMISFVNSVKKWCTSQKMDTSLKDIRDKCVNSSKTLNQKMYDKYMLDLKNLEIDTKGKTFDEKSVENKADTGSGNKKKINVPTDSTDNTDLDKKLLSIKNKEDLTKVLDTYQEKDKIDILKSLKKLVFDKKQITLDLSEAQLNEFVTTYFKNKPVEEVKVEPIDFVPDKMSGDETLINLSNASDKTSFKNALSNIIKKFNDSTEVRNAIMSAITSGKGLHTAKVAKQSITEHHKMIKKAYENYTDSKAE